MKDFKYQIGFKFKNLTIIGHTKMGQRFAYSCQCQCGNILKKRASHIKENMDNYCRMCHFKTGHKIINRKYVQYRRNAKERLYIFELSKIEFVTLIKGNCHYCGDKADKGYNGIDRVDNNIGYTTSNAVSCCELCNRFKLDYSKALFLSHVEKIYNNQLLIKK
jgi:hypothetical protein